MLETMPDTTTEMLAEWETAWGLPDQCTGALDTLAERRSALLARMVHVGQQSPGFFVRVAATLGYSIVIEENVGGSAYVWRIVSSIITAPVYARAGSARSGDPIRTWGGDMLECAMRALNPAHLDLLFAYIEADIAPALVSATIWPDGQTLALTFNQALSQGAGYSDSDFSIDGSLLGPGVAVAYVSGSGTGTHLYTVVGTVRVGETVTLTFTGGATSLVRSDGAYLEPITAMTVFNGSEETEAPPSIVSASVNAAGNQLTVVFSEAMSQGAGYQNTDINLDGSLGGTDIGLTYVSGSGTDTWVFSIATVIRKNETVDLDFIGRLDGIEDADGNDLAAVASMAVLNDSEEDYSDIVLWSGFDGSIAGNIYTGTVSDYPSYHTVTFTSGANVTIDGTIKKVISSLHAVTGDNDFIFDLSGLPDRNFRIGMWYHPVVTSVGTGIFEIFNKESRNNAYVKLYVSGSTTIKLMTDNANQSVQLLSMTIPAQENLWTFYEMSYTESNRTITMRKDGAVIGTLVMTSAFQISDPFNALACTDCTFGTINSYCDNLMVSTDPNRDLYALALLEACPRV